MTKTCDRCGEEKTYNYTSKRAVCNCAPMCRNCGRKKTKVGDSSKKNGYRWRCKPCHSAKETERMRNPPACERCGEQMSKSKGHRKDGGLRWRCYPCMSASKSRKCHSCGGEKVERFCEDARIQKLICEPCEQRAFEQRIGGRETSMCPACDRRLRIVDEFGPDQGGEDGVCVQCRAYMPTGEEIAAACAAVREGWSPNEAAKRGENAGMPLPQLAEYGVARAGRKGDFSYQPRD